MGKDVTIKRRETADGVRGSALMAVASVTAGDVMTSPGPHGPARDTGPRRPCTDGKHHVNSLVVMENGTVTGIIKRDDIIKEVAK
jgi:predicted transcriptional regulator